MFFATSRLGSRKHPTASHHNPIAEVTDELAHPSRVLFTEEVILGICMVITGLLYLFAQMPATVLTTAAAGRSLMRQSVASLVPAAVPTAADAGQPLLKAAEPLFAAIGTAVALEERGAFGPATRAAWQQAVTAADDLAFTPIATASGSLRLWMLPAEEERAKALEARLESLLGPQRQGLAQLRRLQLTPAQAAAVDVPAAARTPAEAIAARAAEAIMAVSWREAAAVVAEPLRTEATSLCRLLEEARDHAAAISRCRGVINFDHWRAIAQVASTPDGLRARAALDRATKAVGAGDFSAAQAAYEEGLTAWQASLMKRPELARHEAVAQVLAEQVNDYRSLLNDMGLPFDEAFSLRSLLRETR